MLSQTYEKYTQKYANFSAKQLAISLENAQKKEEKIKNELAEIKNLAKFLQKQLKKIDEKAERNNFIPLEKSIVRKIYNSITPSEHKELRAEIERDMKEAANERKI